MVIIVAAVARNGVIGKDGKLPWHIPEDLAHFKDITLGKVVIMGRKTYESIGTALSNRINVVITRNLDYSAENCIVVHSFKDALELFSNEELFVIGGEEIFKEAILVADKMYITHINEDFEGDVLFPKFGAEWVEVSREKGIIGTPYEYWFVAYARR